MVTAPDGVEVSAQHAAEVKSPDDVVVVDAHGNKHIVHRRHHTKKQDEEAVMIFFFLVFFMLGAQLLLFWWKKKHVKSYNAVTLLGLWLFPIIISVNMVAIFVKFDEFWYYN